ncbi:MAG: 2,3,4,5-tetrahydropyridine-2,6-dicarboxylate N-acetyltransferase [Fusobacteriaceae bacterium]
MSNMVNHGEEIIKYIRESKKVTPVKVYINGEIDIKCKTLNEIKIFGSCNSYILIGEFSIIEKFIDLNKEKITNYYIENDRRNSAIPMLNKTGINARIEPGAIIRDMVEIGDNAVIMMGAIINIGAKIGSGTMIDMGAILGGRAVVGNNCHIGAGTVLAGVVEPPSATPVIVEDDVLIGANAVVIEGVRIGKGSVVAAGAIVLTDVPSGVVVAGNPARIVKNKDSKTEEKTEIVEDLRKI